MASASKSEIPPRLWLSAFVISLSSFLFGYGMSALNTVLVTGDDNDAHHCYEGTDNSCPEGSLLNDLDLSTELQELATALTILGAWIGCFLSSYPNEKLGRKTTLLANNIFFLSGGILCGISNEYTLYVGRFLVGLGVGVESMVAPVLLSEISSDENRGTITTTHQLMVTIGILGASLLGYAFVVTTEHGWRYAQLFIVVPATLQLLMASYLPESPRWLCQHGRVGEARAIVEKIRFSSKTEGDDLALESEINAMILESGISTDSGETASRGSFNRTGSRVSSRLRTSLSTGSGSASSLSEGKREGPTWSEVFSHKKAMIIGLTLMSMTALTGINTVIFYSTTIFGYAGVDEDIVGTISVTAVNVAMTLLSSYLVDKSGRKILILWGNIISFVALGLLGTALMFEWNGYLSVLAVVFYVVGFGVGPGAVTWVIMSEITPLRIRSKAYSLFVSINWFWNLLIALFTLSTISYFGGGDDDDEQRVGVAYLYFLFLAVLFVDLVFIMVYVPETKPSNIGMPSSSSDASGETPLLASYDNETGLNSDDEDVILFSGEGRKESDHLSSTSRNFAQNI